MRSTRGRGARCSVLRGCCCFLGGERGTTGVAWDNQVGVRLDPRGATVPLATGSSWAGHWEQLGSLGACRRSCSPALSPGSLPGYGSSGRGGGGNNYSGGASYNTGSHGGYGGGSGGGGSSYQGKQGQYNTLPRGSFPFGALFLFFGGAFSHFGARGQVPKSHPRSTGGAPPALQPSATSLLSALPPQVDIPRSPTTTPRAPAKITAAPPVPTRRPKAATAETITA